MKQSHLHSKPDANHNEQVEILGARVHNLRNIDVTFPRNHLVVVTGLSGSGKSSLAFDTIYAEGQRRYIETFSAYARQFLGGLERPDVDKISGLSPVISIEQKTTNKNPRSTVGTTTEIYDFLRLLYARAGEAISYNTGEKMVKYTDLQILDLILKVFNEKQVYILAPLVNGRKGHYRELFEQTRKKGFLNVRVDGEVREIRHGMKLDRYKNHFIEVVIDKLTVTDKDRNRLDDSVKLAMKQGNNIMMVLEKESSHPRYFSRQLMCPTTGISYNEPSPHNFSYNSPQGACPSCKGLGVVEETDMSQIIPDPSLSIARGGIAPLGKHRNNLIFWQIEAIADKHGFTLKTPIHKIPDEGLETILHGSSEPLTLKNTPLGATANYYLSFEGVISYIHSQQENQTSRKARKWATQFIKTITCPQCQGRRLNREALHFFIDNKNIAELGTMDLGQLSHWFMNLEERLTPRQKTIAAEVLKEIRSRLSFLMDVGLEYLSLNRSSRSLSGGESQRIRLATQIGSQLVNVLYILDEPSIGLHQRDNHRLIESLKQLRDTGNSIMVVEHDRDMMMAADHVIDMGPFAGRHGGEVVAQGTPGELLRAKSLTADYLNHVKSIPLPIKRNKGNGKKLTLEGASGNNLKNITVSFPLGTFICITGVSGSGKSTLVNETLYPILNKHVYNAIKEPLPHSGLKGVQHIDKVVDVDQAPLGRTPRSNPATYTKLFDDIRKLYAGLPESKIRAYQPGRFSFNVKGGRCETCKGAGVQVIEMNFLPDVITECPQCHGKRYNRETLEVRFKGKSISDVLNMTINQAVEFFENIPALMQRLKVLQEVGLGYIRLGQPSTTLSGGESQRVKLAAELSKRDTGKTVYILDEPTTGLHFEDIRVLLEVLNKLVQRGNTVIVIEHNLDVIKTADHIIDVGPEGGSKGGYLICSGTPEKVAQCKESYTGRFLKQELEQYPKPKTQNPKPETRNPKPKTRNPKPETQKDMTKTVTIKCLNNQQSFEVERGSNLLEISKNVNIQLDYPILGALVNNRIRELSFEVFNPKAIQFIDITHKDGLRMYTRSLFFLLYAAVEEVFPDARLLIDHSVSKGYYCELSRPGGETTIDDVFKIGRKMKELVEADLPFVHHKEETEKVIKIFEKRGMDDKVKLLRHRGQYYSSYYTLNGHPGIFYGFMVPSTGYLRVFDLNKYYNGMLLQVPKQDNPNEVQELVVQNKMFEIFSEYSHWNRVLKVTRVSDINEAASNGMAESLIKVSEALHEKKIAQIADNIAAHRDKLRLVLISGPSSSGKTTFGKRLAIQLVVNGIRPLNLSLDNYFVNRVNTPLDEHGEYDFESLEALDIETFNQDLVALLNGKEISLPKYSFEKGERFYDGEKLKMTRENILIIEGIHGLNPKLTPAIAHDAKYKIYVSALTNINIDDHSRIPTTDNRLIRRIVRDYRYRNYTALETISRWRSVRRGEEKHIFPYQEEADVMFNSALLYELGVLKPLAEHILLEVQPNQVQYAEAVRLLKFFSYFKTIKPEGIPPTSIIREFMGGSSFVY